MSGSRTSGVINVNKEAQIEFQAFKPSITESSKLILNFLNLMIMSQLYENTMGIDVSKDTLDCSIAQGGTIKDTFSIANDKRAVKQLVSKLEKQNIDKSNTIFCFENTSLYNHNLAYELSRHQVNVWIENALAIKKSSGLTRGKNDKIDA